MKKNKKVEEYEALYGNIPEEYTTRILSLMRELKIIRQLLKNKTSVFSQSHFH